MKFTIIQKIKTNKVFSALMSGIILLVGGTLNAQATSINENFGSNTLPSTLEIAGSAVNFNAGSANFYSYDHSQRSYLRTVDNFFNTSFVAEVTIITGDHQAYFGIGEGSPYGHWFEPGNSGITLRMHPTWLASGQFDVVDGNLENVGTTDSIMGYPGNGTHRLQLDWDAITKTAVFKVDANYTGGAFTADLTSQLFNGADNNFSAANSKIYFGGDSGVSFDDFIVTTANSPNLVPEPAPMILLFSAVAFYLYRKSPATRQDTCEYGALTN